MKPKKTFFLIAILILAALMATTSVMAKKPVFTNEQVLWELSKVNVSNPGETIELKEGILIRGIVIESKAKAKGVNDVPEGNFNLTMDAFMPYNDMPGQQAGYWYVQGNWSISKKDASSESLKARHSPDVLRGYIKAQLTFNPMESNQRWSALAAVPMSLGLGRWSEGQGSLSFDPSFAGSLYLDLSRWPEIQ